MSSSVDQVDVYLDAAEIGPLQRIGGLVWNTVRGHHSIAFTYDPSWLESEHTFLLDPSLELFQGQQYPAYDRGQFGIFMDSAPDRWGRLLMDRREVQTAAQAQRAARHLSDWDYLLGVQDVSRLGALRFARASDAVFQAATAQPVPPLARLRELEHAAWILDGAGTGQAGEIEQQLQILLAPGSSLGGARPKAGFSDTDGSLWLAKFPASNDRRDVAAWEYLLHGLAVQAGITVPSARLMRLANAHRTFCVKRFDRENDGVRRHFASAMTLLGRTDGSQDASYLDMALLLQDMGDPDCLESDLTQLFRRVLFNRLVGNRDDHLRNHGFFRTRGGWRLAPAYDQNPAPEKRGHVLALDARNQEAGLPEIMATAGYYRCTAAQASAILEDVRAAIANWRAAAAELDIPNWEIETTSAAFTELR